MKFIISFLFLLMSLEAFSGTCTSVSRTAYTANQVLTSTALNADFDQLVTSNNAYDAGCVTDGTLEDGALNTTDFAAPLNGIREGCETTRSTASTLTTNKCILSVNGSWVKTSAATTTTFGCTSCSAEATGTTYYLYAKNGSSGTSFTGLISTTSPNGDGLDSSGNKILSRFYNDATGDINAYSIDQWVVNKFIPSNTDWTSYTPTSFGLGTLTSVDCRWKRSGPSIDIICEFTTGTVAADEAQIGLPTDLSIDSTAVPNIKSAGMAIKGSTGAFTNPVLITGGDTFVNFGLQGASNAGLTPIAGNAGFASDTAHAFHATNIPITGWKN